MGQNLIWEHFQNEGVASFSGATPRLEFIVGRLRRGQSVLNIGVGSGELEILAHRRGVDIWSLDPSERAIERVRNLLPVKGKALTGYSNALPFADSQFDAVVMTEVLEHLETEVREKTLAEVRRVLKTGGRFIGTVPAREQLDVSRVVCPSCGHHFHRWGHQAAFDVDGMTEVLKTRFAVETVHERFFNEWQSVSWVRRATGLLKKFLSWRGMGTYGVARNIYFVARKTAKQD